MKTDIDSPLLTSQEAASYLRMSRSTLYRLTSSQRIKSITIGTRTPYYLRSDLDLFIDKCAQHG
jgi:excisionase family DNA binding protein